MDDEYIDLKWDPVDLGITLDEDGVEPLTVSGEYEPVRQSIHISIRGSQYSRLMIAGDPKTYPGLIQKLIEELENNHRHIILGSIDPTYELIPGRKVGKLNVSMSVETPSGLTLPVYFEDVLA